jgi:Ca2+-binding RTX toxin-like protein
MRVMREGRRLHRAGWIRRLLSLAGLLGLLGTGSPAIAADACSFDAATATVTASVSGFTPETSLRNTMAVSGVAILFEGERCGEATTTNTDTIMVTGSGRDDVLVVDIRSGPFAPGATPDPDGSSEIEFNVDLGGGPDLLRIFGTRGPDRIVVGSSGVNLDGDAAANITTTRMAVLVFGLGRDDVLNGRGGAGTGGEHEVFLGLFGGGGEDRLIGGSRSDTLVAGGGADVLIDHGGADILVGRAGRDILKGDGGGDLLIGGPGRDRMRGGPGHDQLRGVAGNDLLRGGPGHDELNGGAGVDTCRGGPGDSKVSCERQWRG